MRREKLPTPVFWPGEFHGQHVCAFSEGMLVAGSRWGFPDGSDGKESACNAGDPGSIPGLGREWLPIPTFLPGEFCGQKSLVGYGNI